MNITILNYHDQALVDQINAEAARRAEAARAAAEAASLSADSSFAAVLDEASGTGSTGTVSLTDCSDELNAIFEEAASTYGVSVRLLKSIARAESNFNPNAVSSAGAVGIMQLMPATAASLGVTDSYDPRQNIMGGAKLISQLLSKYNGDTSLALAAYNAGSGNVDKYGGIPPFTETQNYVKKVLSYMNAEVTESASDAVTNTLTSDRAGTNTLDLLVALLKLVKEETSSPQETAVPANTITSTVADDSNIVATGSDGAVASENVPASAETVENTSDSTEATESSPGSLGANDAQSVPRESSENVPASAETAENTPGSAGANDAQYVPGSTETAENTPGSLGANDAQSVPGSVSANDAQYVPGSAETPETTSDSVSETI